MGMKYADEAEQVAHQADALRKEHEDLAPHEGCSCRLCLLLREVERLRTEELNWTRERADLQCMRHVVEVARRFWSNGYSSTEEGLLALDEALCELERVEGDDE